MRRLTTTTIWIGVGTAVATLAVVAPAMAEVRVGGVGGMNLATLSTEEEGVALGTLTRWGAGGVLEVDLGERLAVATRPMFVGRGADIEALPGVGEVAALGPGSHARTELDYIELPLLLKYSLPTEGVRPYLIAGPSLGIRLDATGVTKFGTAPEERESIEDLETTDWSLMAGAGLGANVGSAYVFAEAVYALGLTDLNKDVRAGSGQNRGLQLRAGVTLRLGGRR